MLFDFKLEINESTQSIPQYLLQKLHKNRAYAFVSVVSILLAIYSSFFIGLAFCLAGGMVSYVAILWDDVSTLSFNLDLTDFTLQDVINDLEGR